jgi:NAD(P)H-quinone oxidoreductase subunit 4L
VSVDLEHYLAVGALLFAIGLYLTLAKRNFVGILMGIEVMFNSVNLTLLAFARFVQSPEPLTGHVFVLFIIAVAAAEAAIALAIAVLIYRSRETIDIDRINLLKW